jgi:hypothetical protein
LFLLLLFVWLLILILIVVGVGGGVENVPVTNILLVACEDQSVVHIVYDWQNNIVSETLLVTTDTTPIPPTKTIKPSCTGRLQKTMMMMMIGVTIDTVLVVVEVVVVVAQGPYCCCCC